MADVAAVAGASKPLLYHYFSTKSELYRAAVRTAAEELRAVTAPPVSTRASNPAQHALSAHVAWIAANADAYRAVLQGGVSSDPVVAQIVEDSRNEAISRVLSGTGISHPTAAQHTVLQGWVGFLERSCLDWLEDRDLPETELVGVLTSALAALIRVARSLTPRPTPDGS